MSLCVSVVGKKIAVAATAFSLSWVHSVEKTEWHEFWVVTENGLVLEEARIKGSGAGMDPGEGAKLVEGWWRWKPDIPPIKSLHLSTSGATVSGWKLCYDAGSSCISLDERGSGVVTISECDHSSPME